MSAFISYSQIDAAAFGTLCLALRGEGIPYWKPETMEVGGSLSDQLRKAISRCDVCIFLATRNSVDSKWCLAEVGAFWGAGKQVIVFLAESGVDQEKIPPQFKGDLLTSDVENVIRVARSKIIDATDRRRQELSAKPKLVSEMTIEEFYEVVASLRTQSGERLPLDEVMRLLKERFSSNSLDAEAVIRPLVSQLIDVPTGVLQTSAQRHWQLPFVLTTDTGEWLGYSNSPLRYSDLSGYSNCLLILCDDRRCIAAIAVNSVWKRLDTVNYGETIIKCGAVDIGEPKHFSP